MAESEENNVDASTPFDEWITTAALRYAVEKYSTVEKHRGKDHPPVNPVDVEDAFRAGASATLHFLRQHGEGSIAIGAKED